MNRLCNALSLSAGSCFVAAFITWATAPRDPSIGAWLMAAAGIFAVASFWADPDARHQKQRAYRREQRAQQMAMHPAAAAAQCPRCQVVRTYEYRADGSAVVTSERISCPAHADPTSVALEQEATR